MIAALISSVIAKSRNVWISLMLRIIVLSALVLRLIELLLVVVSVLRLILAGESGESWRRAVRRSWRITRHGRHRGRLY